MSTRTPPRADAGATRTRMLASVGTSAEVHMALAAGADIIDFKDASSGALAALPVAQVADLTALVAGRRLTSTVAGEHPASAAAAARAVRSVAQCGTDFIKVGIRPEPEPLAALRAARDALPSTGPRLIALFFADLAFDFDWLSAAADHGYHGVMLDTAYKRAGSLAQHWSSGALAEFVAQARARRLLCGLAGSLRVDDIAALLALEPDLLGFRGALCAGDRGGVLDLDAARSVRAAMPGACMASAAADADRVLPGVT